MNTVDKANELRKEVLDVAIKNKQGHISPSLSCLDILTVLHYKVADRRDTVILSKGHGCYGLYAIWADLGLLASEKWQNFDMPGCVEGYGSLGHGLPVAVGVAFANKQLGKDTHTWVIVGDGEMTEGSNWEALSFMYHHQLDNITVIVDHNRLQAMDKIDNIMYQDLIGRFIGWGFTVQHCNGHDHDELSVWLKMKPEVLIADTLKGYGVDFMQDKAEWHFRCPTKQEFEEWKKVGKI